MDVRVMACARVLPVVLALVVPTAVLAAELHERTRQEYDAYVEGVRKRFLERVASNPGPQVELTDALRAGVPAGRPGHRSGIIGIHRGLVHHWAGHAFIDGVTLDEVLAVSHQYDDYHRFYESLERSRLVRRDGDTYHLELRAREGVAGVTVVLDVRSRVTYHQPRPGFVYSMSASDEIREVKDADTPRERHQPVGNDSGYLWAAATFTTFTERGGGVFMEVETLGLSRRFPPVVGWVIEPIVRRLGRKSVEGSLRDFQTAVRDSLASASGH